MTPAASLSRLVALAGLLLAVEASAGTALKVTLQVDSGTPVTITDSNDPNSDLNPQSKAIDLSTVVDGVLAADARVEQVDGLIQHMLEIESRTVGGNAVFRNLDGASAHTFTVTVESDTFTAPGSPLGWAVFYDGTADDALAGDVEVAPENDVAAFVDPGTGFVPLPMASLSEPITPPVPALGQPVDISASQRGFDPNADAVRSRLTWTFHPGPNDEIRLPDGAAIELSVFNQQDICVVRMNQIAGTIAAGAGKGDRKCLSLHFPGDAGPCIDGDGADPVLIRKEPKALATFARFCSSPPAFGANVGSCCLGGANHGSPCAGDPNCPGGSCTAGQCLNGAIEQAADALAHDFFGATVTQTDRRCQAGVLKAATQLHTTRWKVFFKVKKRNIRTIATESDFVTTCLGPPQTDFNARIARSEAKFIAAVLRSCSAGSLATVLPGACASRSDTEYPGCLARRVACRFCLAATAADDIQAPLDCDAFANDPNVPCP